MRRQSLRCLRGKGVRCLGRLHDPHQGQSQKERLNRIERPILTAKGLSWGASSGEEMGGGADDLLAPQASQPAYSLVQEGGELVGIDPVGLRPRVAQLGGFRIESKLGGTVLGLPTTLARAVFAVPFYSVVVAARSLVFRRFAFGVLGSLSCGISLGEGLVPTYRWIEAELRETGRVSDFARSARVGPDNPMS